MDSSRAAGDEEDDHAQQRADGGSQGGPGGGAPVRARDGGGVVDPRLDDAEGDKVQDHDNDSDDESQSSDQRGEERADKAGAEGEEEGDEVETAGNGVQDHRLGERLGGVLGIVGERDALDRAHHVGGVVADVGGRAGVTV